MSLKQSRNSSSAPCKKIESSADLTREHWNQGYLTKTLVAWCSRARFLRFGVLMASECLCFGIQTPFRYGNLKILVLQSNRCFPGLKNPNNLATAMNGPAPWLRSYHNAGLKALFQGVHDDFLFFIVWQNRQQQDPHHAGHLSKQSIKWWQIELVHHMQRKAVNQKWREQRPRT